MEWFDDYPGHYRLRPDDTGAEEAEFIQRVLRLRKGHAVLDAPCGAGRISACLARAGLRVTGVDLTPGYVARAKRRFRREGLGGEFIVSDLRRIDFVERFDGAFNWQGSFGFFGERENLEVVQRYARALRRGGRLLIDQPNREYLLRHFRAAGGDDITFRVRWSRRTERFTTTFRDTRTGESWSMTIRFYTPAQFGELLRRAGLEVEGMYGDLAATPYHRGARRIYVVGRKR